MDLPYVAMGDSYSAGVGAGGGTGWCLRGPQGYPLTLARELGLDVAYVSCNGALIDDLLVRQLPWLGESTGLVTLTIGGDDAGFATVLRTAAAPWWLGNGVAAVDRAERYIREVLPHRLRSTYTLVQAAAPNAQVLVATYPRLFGDPDRPGGGDCQLLTFFTDTELRRLNAAADLLAEVVVAAAEAAGVESVDVRERFTGHEICDPEPFVNGLVLPIIESFHPRAEGHDAYAVALAEPVLWTERTRGPGETPVEPRVETGPDADREGPVLWLPRLDSKPSLRAARAAGLDIERVRVLGAALGRWWSGPFALDGAEVLVGGSGADSAPTPAEVAAAAELRELSDRALAPR